MQRPHNPRKRRQKPADLDYRKPFTRAPWWLRAIAALPLPVWYRIADLLAWLAEYVIHHRREIIDSQLRRCFPDRDEAWLVATRRGFYRNFGDVVVEIVKGVSISEDEIRRRVTLVDAGPARAMLDAGQSIIVVSSHNCNWEWCLLELSTGLGHPLDVAYKPLRGRWGDQVFLTIRSRFGARMIPARRLLLRVLRHRRQARIVALVADQDPGLASARHFTDFFGQRTAFYKGLDAISRVGRMPVYYLAMRRVSRGSYSVTFEPLAAADEALPEGQIIDRYARRVEALTREHPSDWLWTYRRWKVHGPRAEGEKAAQVEASSGSD